MDNGVPHSAPDGQYLVNEIRTNGPKLGLKLGFVWNRTKSEDLYASVGGERRLILDELSHFDRYPVDMIVEVSHPCVIYEFGHKFIQHSDLMVRDI
ncbi:unnamed protein product [Medioppia subpectinata]|uniref:Uncharacterized protein n=1 Tax=Medioppia subpectinata TaxID=1979941 RepID=A0A7R9Q4S1_9ACAR|nr:unnamed protein product [Medioppia subpectinata]CAG2112965.1 unnamed protein product [Medioppia subpectinata]